MKRLDNAIINQFGDGKIAHTLKTMFELPFLFIFVFFLNFFLAPNYFVIENYLCTMCLHGELTAENVAENVQGNQNRCACISMRNNSFKSQRKRRKQKQLKTK